MWLPVWRACPGCAAQTHKWKVQRKVFVAHGRRSNQCLIVRQTKFKNVEHNSVIKPPPPKKMYIIKTHKEMFQAPDFLSSTSTQEAKQQECVGDGQLISCVHRECVRSAKANSLFFPLKMKLVLSLKRNVEQRHASVTWDLSCSQVMVQDDSCTLEFVFQLLNPMLCVISKSTMCNYGNHSSSQRPLCFPWAPVNYVFHSVYGPSPLTSSGVCLEKPISVFRCHGKLQGLFSIWCTWKCCDSIRIPFDSICYTGNHCGQWWPIIHG